MERWKRATAGLLALVAVGATATAEAQYLYSDTTSVSASSRRQARKLLREGHDRLRERRYLAAAERFRQSLQLERRALTQLNLAYALALAGWISEAVQTYEQVLATYREIRPTQREDLQRRLRALRLHLAAAPLLGSSKQPLKTRSLAAVRSRP